MTVCWISETKIHKKIFSLFCLSIISFKKYCYNTTEWQYLQVLSKKLQMPNTLAYFALFKKVNNNTTEWQSLQVFSKKFQMPNTLAYLAWVSLFKKVNNNTTEWQSLQVVRKKL
jgi:hypothetical protein